MLHQFGTKTVEIFIVAIAKLISADVLSVILVATDRVRMHHSLVSSEIGLEQSLLLNQVPELPGGKLIGHPCPKSLSSIAVIPCLMKQPQ
mgnify:FL=1|jgi:hypothetical protein